MKRMLGWLISETQFPGAEQISPDSPDGMSVGFLWGCGKSSTLVHSVGDIRARRFLQEVKLANDGSVFPRLIEGFSVRVGLQDFGSECRSIGWACVRLEM